MTHTPLTIDNTPNCLPHPWHPSVIYTPEGWNGHRWWMAQTPFPPFDMPPYRDRHELPCIHYSDDGRRWHPIDSNPIDNIDSAMEEAHDYLSDPHLVLRDGVLECYYRLSLLKDRQLVGNKTLLLRKTSADGIHWSDREVVADLRREEDLDVWGEQIISQAVLWDEGQYRCWYVDRSSYLKGRQVLTTASADGKSWDRYQTCTLAGAPQGLDPWHLDVQHYDGSYQMIVYDGWSLHWFESADGFRFDYVGPILTPSLYFGDFYSNGLYRACSLKVENNILVYFSAKNPYRSFIGLLKTRDRKHFQPVSGDQRLKYLWHNIVPQISSTNCKRMVKRWMRRLGWMRQKG